MFLSVSYTDMFSFTNLIRSFVLEKYAPVNYLDILKYLMLIFTGFVNTKSPTFVGHFFAGILGPRVGRLSWVTCGSLEAHIMWVA